MNRIFCLITGAGIGVFGIFLVIGIQFSFRGTIINFGEANVLVGWIFIIIGIGIFVIALRKKAKEFEDKFLICPECKKPFDKKDVPNGRCPKCGVELEDLERFYDRHPELRAR